MTWTRQRKTSRARVQPSNSRRTGPRWAIETHCDWLKNGMGLQGLCQRDHCRAQGLAFVCLVASLVRRELADLIGERLPGHTVDEALLDARLVKAHLRAGR